MIRRATLGVLEHRDVAALDREDPAAVGGREADFVVGQPAHDHVLDPVHVEHPAQIGAGETLRVAVVAGGSHDAQLQDLPLRDRHRERRQRHRRRIHRVGKVVVLAGEDSVDHLPLHVQAPGHDQIAVGGAGTLAPQVAGGEERAVECPTTTTCLP